MLSTQFDKISLHFAKFPIAIYKDILYNALEERQMTPMSLCDRIKSLRNAQGYTQKETAAIIGVAESTYAMYESGRREPDVEKIRKLSSFFKVSGDYLLGIDEGGASQELGLIISLYLSADDRAKNDAILLLRNHQLINSTNNSSIMDAARHVIETAKAQNGILDSQKLSK